MRIIFQLSVILALLFLCGCSQSGTIPSGVAGDPGHQEGIYSFSDGTTMQVRKRSGDELQGVRIARKSPEGLQESYVAERGKISEEPGGIVRVTLYEAQVDRGSRGRMTVQELSIGLVR